MVSFKRIAMAAVAALGMSTAVVASNSVTFISQDGLERIVSFTCNPGMTNPAEFILPGHAVQRVQFPAGKWSGTFMARLHGAVHPIHRVIGEVTFENEKTWYDVSAIDNHTDSTGVKYLYPIGVELTKYNKPGCDTFPCDNCYLYPDDVHTRAVAETSDMICLVGN